jgi:hypothetical protein
VPRVDIESRLRLGYRVLKTIQIDEGISIALAWLMGVNCRLEDKPRALCPGEA